MTRSRTSGLRYEGEGRGATPDTTRDARANTHHHQKKKKNQECEHWPKAFSPGHAGGAALMPGMGGQGGEKKE